MGAQGRRSSLPLQEELSKDLGRYKSLRMDVLRSIGAERGQATHRPVVNWRMEIWLVGSRYVWRLWEIPCVKRALVEKD